jgi:hypothetical protein
MHLGCSTGTIIPSMRWRLAQVALLSPPWILCQSSQLQGQEIRSSVSASHSPCQTSHASRTESLAPRISVAEVNFSGDLHLPIEDRDEVASSIKQGTHGKSVSEVVEQARERTRYGWQNHGYFWVQVRGEARILDSDSRAPLVALDLRVNEGIQYRLSGISFQRKQNISKIATLRSFFPINDGDIFSREKIAIGLENLRKAYGHLGYLNFTALPGEQLDDPNQSISLVIDLDEGKRFYVGSVNVWGLDPASAAKVLSTLPIRTGGVYDSQLYERLVAQYASVMPDCACDRSGPISQDERTEDMRTGMVAINLDFRPCSDR